MALPSGEFMMALLLMVAHLRFSQPKNWRKVDTDCPELEFCYCQLIKRGAKILCRDIDSSDDLARELSKLSNTSIFQLTVKQVNLTVLPSFYFADLKMRAKRLVFVDLHNNRIKMIYEAFQGLLQLQELLLFNNSIINIDRLSMGNVPNLRILRAAHNSITDIRKYGPVNVALVELDLRHCNISMVDSEAFRALGDLKKVDLSENSISYINGTAFYKQSKLENFNAAKNVIISVRDTFKNTQRLRILNLSMNRISDITEAFLELRSLTSLTLTMNEIQFVGDSTFENSGNLKRLNLSFNKIRWLGKKSFKGLVNLKLLLMNNNLFLTLNGSLSHMPMLKYIYLEDNHLEVFKPSDFDNDPQLGFIYAFRNNLTSVNGAFRSLRNLQVVLLQRNRLQAVHRQSFPRSLNKLRTLVIEANPIVCDCLLSWLMTEAVHVTKRGVPMCQGPAWLEGNLLYNLTLENLTTWKEGCDPNCICECVDDGAFGRHVFVDCSDRDLTQLPATLPADTRALDLSGNKLESLDSGPSNTAGLAKKAPFLRLLNLSNNLLSSIDPSEIPQGTDELFLRGNRLSRFPIDLVSKFNMSILELAGNPWNCDCEDYAFRQWAEAYTDVVEDAEEITCAKGPNQLVSLKRFMDLGQKDLCPSMMSKILSYGLPLLVLLIISLAASTAYLRHKRAIKVWLYARGVCSSLQCIKEDDLDEDKIFDVFLSFSSKDSMWAYEQLIPGVEAHGFSVCTYDRNFKGGFLLQDIIHEAVSCSRRTLLLLTKNFVESEWCRWEFRVAHHQALEDKINRLILVLVDELAPGLVDEELQLYMQATNYLRWGEPHFWDKLIYSLPKKDAKRKLILSSQEYPMTVQPESTEP
ncbi:protein toll isoform X2 [Ixodes scapularis]|uniref:protein toll isoform X2 n=1 Tax=Ixodes scapularis TaxID=6945 RepID=UPI001A9FC5F7|nr:protein toll isoform X2 [Ixodes scapularis]XP_042143092.1 protein toll isoform X2 [Ixodes scapularis]